MGPANREPHQQARLSANLQIVHAIRLPDRHAIATYERGLRAKTAWSLVIGLLNGL